MLAKNSLFYTAGLGFLALAKAKHALVGYSSPKPITDVEGCAEYDIGIASACSNSDLVPIWVLGSCC